MFYLKVNFLSHDLPPGYLRYSHLNFEIFCTSLKMKNINFNDHKLICLSSITCSIASATSGGILDRAVEAEDKKHGDILRLVKPLSFQLVQLVFYLTAQQIYYVGTFHNVLIWGKSWSKFVFINFVKAGSCWGLSWIVSKDEDIFCHCCCFMGCRFLRQSWWWCTCKYRYIFITCSVSFVGIKA